MIAALGFILSGVELIGSYVLWAIETAWNALMAMIGAAVSALLALLPAMTAPATVGSPTWLQWLNWFYPVGALLAGLAVGVAIWVAYLVIRYALRLVRAL